MKFLRNQIQEEKNKEECTFAPKINTYSVKRSATKKTPASPVKRSTPGFSNQKPQHLGMSPAKSKSPTKSTSSYSQTQKLRASIGNFSSGLSAHQSNLSPRTLKNSAAAQSNKASTSVLRQSVQTPTRPTKPPVVVEDDRQVISVSQLCRNFELMGVNPQQKKHTSEVMDTKHSVSVKKARIANIVDNSKQEKAKQKVKEDVENMTPRLNGSALQFPDYDKENCFQAVNRVSVRSPLGKKSDSPLTFAKSSRINVTFDGVESLCSSPTFCKPSNNTPKSNPFEDTVRTTGSPRFQTGAQTKAGVRRYVGDRGGY